MDGVFDPVVALERLKRIEKLMDDLTKARGDFAEQQDLSERIRRELQTARLSLEPFLKHKFPTE